VVPSLNHFEEESWSVLDWLHEDLEKVTFLVVVDEDFLLLQNVDVFGDLERHLGNVLPNVVIVGVWDR